MNVKINYFAYYSYLSGLGWKIMDILPPFIRYVIFKILLKKTGRHFFVDYGSYLRNMNKISFGNGVFINRRCSFFGSYHVAGAEIILGNNVIVGPYVTFWGAGHDYHSLTLPDIAKTITVGNNVWIGGGAVILPGVTIGEGAVIGASSVVTKDVEPYTVVAGNPAKTINKRNLSSHPKS
jgi:acetyltransferase-like isoleucine patch superfamily enzyme